VPVQRAPSALRVPAHQDGPGAQRRPDGACGSGATRT
jgi:hypothetical protein